MRTTIVYILRLLVDETEPGALRGILRDVSSGEERAFTSEQGLLDWLHLQAGRSSEPADANQTNQSQRSDS